MTTREAAAAHYAELNRQVKVAKIVEQAASARDGRGYTAQELAGFTMGQRDLLAQAAGCHPPSEETWERVVNVTADREAKAAAWAAGADPWEGI